MATAPPVVEKVTRTRTIPPAELAQEKPVRTTPDFWEFIEKMTPEMWGGDYTLYILREDPKPSLYGGTNTLEKCPGYISMPDGSKQPLNSREDIELAIKQKYGGKAFRLILKRANGERICEGKCTNEAQPRFPDADPRAYTNPLPNANNNQPSDANAIASKAIDTVANQPQEAMNIAISALRAASEMMTKSAAPAVPPTQSLENDLDRAFKAAMIKKLLDPPPDPVESFLRIRQALGSGDGGGGSQNPLVDKLLNAAVDRFMNPAAAVTGRTTLLDLGREFIPVLGTTVRETMHEYRLAREADVRLAEMSRGMQPPPAAQVPNATVIGMDTAATPAPNPAPQPAAQQPPSFSWVAERVAKIVRNVDFPVEEAVDRVISFLYDTDEKLVGLLLNPPKLDPRLAAGKQGLVQLFQYEPALKECMVNTPRVSEFIDKFIVAAQAAEEVEARLRAAAPAAATATPAPHAPVPS